MNLVSLHKWLGRHGPPIDPDAARFKEAEVVTKRKCSRCMFRGQPSAVCRRANELAIAAGFSDCDTVLPDGKQVVYVAIKVDPRQLQLIENITEENNE